MGMKDAWMSTALRVGKMGNKDKLAALVADAVGPGTTVGSGANRSRRMGNGFEEIARAARAQQAVTSRGSRRMMYAGGGLGGAALLSGMNGRSSGVQGIAPRSSGGYA